MAISYIACGEVNVYYETLACKLGKVAKRRAGSVTRKPFGRVPPLRFPFMGRKRVYDVLLQTTRLVRALHTPTHSHLDLYGYLARPEGAHINESQMSRSRLHTRKIVVVSW